MSYKQRGDGLCLFLTAVLVAEKGRCEFIVNERKREIAKLESACCVNKMSEFAFVPDEFRAVSRQQTREPESIESCDVTRYISH
jgi:hypothetical protein